LNVFIRLYLGLAIPAAVTTEKVKNNGATLEHFIKFTVDIGSVDKLKARKLLAYLKTTWIHFIPP
tara:strand:- start:2950 stop:3144 length:195 start_codon:yes stop_codon:yes gene_type:complete